MLEQPPATPTTSTLSSSIRDYIYENGRRYHRYQEGKYVLPNDETEQDRLDLHHHVFLLLAEGNLTFAPVKSPRNILDVGTGTGIWALDAADCWPNSEVTGIDLSPIQPTWTVPNCSFEVDDAELMWTFPVNHFDLIHSRAMAQSIRDWPTYIHQMYKHTSPGGYIEIVEIAGKVQCDDDTLHDDSGLKRYFAHWTTALGIVLGSPQPIAADYVHMLTAAGFIDIEVHTRKQIFNPWPKDRQLKEIGVYSMLNAQTSYHAYGIALFTRALGMKQREAEMLCEAAARDSVDGKIHAYNDVWYVVARKPPAGCDDGDERDTE